LAHPQDQEHTVASRGPNPHLDAKITDEDIAKMRLLVGQPERYKESPWNPVATVNDFARFQHGLGDDNPLYSDPQYAAKSRWGGVIAPPMFVIAMGREVTGPLPDDLQRKTKGALSGVRIHQTYPGRLDYRKRKRMPRFHVPGRYGFPEPVQRMHRDEEWAKHIGLPMAYDYGMMRAACALQYLTNWAGDDAWLWKASVDIRRFNFHGDTQWFHGTVTGKRKEGPHHCAEVSLRAENQRGETTTLGRAMVILPSRKGGPSLLPAASV
jgi:acyl dehydratase